MFSIIHLSDIHILDKRYDEYIEVFDNLIDICDIQIKSRQSEGLLPLITILGDIFDRKINTTPKEQDAFYYLIKALMRFHVPLIIIPGNHDCNMNNANTLDLITPLVDAINSKDSSLYYFKKSRVYKLHNPNYQKLRFHVFSPIDMIIPDFGEHKEPDLIHIALVHETIRGAVIPTSGIIWNDKTRLDAQKLSATYHLTLLGDIHKYQLLETNIGYCGSLVQQNIGEHPLDHGFIEWIVASNKISHTFHRVINPRGSMIKIKLANNKVTEPLPEDLSAVQNIIIEHRNCDAKFIEKMSELVKKKFSTEIFKTVDTGIYNITGSCDEKKSSAEAFTWINHQDSLAKYLAEHKIAEEHQRVILEKHSAMMRTKSQTFGHLWRPIYMEWKNMFCYGGDKINYIAFGELFTKGNLIGIVGNNKSGKSSIWDIMIYLLWNETRRGTVDEVINSDAKSYSALIKFAVDEDEYVLVRSGDKKKHSDLKIYKRGKNITQESIPKSYSMLEDLLGDYNNFATINYQEQYTKLFTEMSYTEQSKYIYRILGIDHLSEIEKEVKTEIRVLKASKKSILKPEKTTSEYLSQLGTTQFEYEELKSELDDINEHLNEIETTIMDLTREIGDRDLDDIETIAAEIKKKKKIIKEGEDLILEDTEELITKRTNLQQKRAVYENKIAGYTKPSKTLKEIQTLMRNELTSSKFTEQELVDKIHTLQSSTKPLWKRKSNYSDDIEEPDEVPEINDKTYREAKKKLLDLNHTRSQLISQLDKNSDIDNESDIEYTEKELLGKIEQLSTNIDYSVENQFEKIGSFEFNKNCNCCVANRKILEIDNITTIYEKHKKALSLVDKFRSQLSTVKYRKISAEIASIDKEITKESNTIEQYNLYQNYLEHKENYDWLQIHNENIDIETEIKELEEELDAVRLSASITKWNEYYAAKSKIDKLSTEIDELDEKIKLRKIIKEQIAEVQQAQLELVKLEKQYKKYKHLQTVQEQLDLAITERGELVDKKTRLDKKISKLTTSITQCESNIAVARHYETQNAATDKEISTLDIYKKALCSKNGFSISLLDNAAKYLVSSVNAILGYVCKDILSYRYHNGISFVIDKTPIRGTSGFQRMIINIALRLAFMSLANTGGLSMWTKTMVIDEGLLGACDKTHMHQLLKIFFPTLAMQGIKFIIISHQEELVAHMEFIINVDQRRYHIKYGTKFDFVAPSNKTKKEKISKDAIMVLNEEENKYHCTVCNRTISPQNHDRHIESAGHLANLDHYDVVEAD